MRRLALLVLVAALLGAGPGPTPRDRGDQAWQDGDTAEALVEWSRALATAREEADDDAVVALALRIAAAHRRLGRVDTANDALDLGRAHADTPTEQARITAARGQIALARGDAAEAEELLHAAFQAHQQAENPPDAANAAVGLGLARLARGRLDEATRAFVAAASLFEALGDDTGRADALTDLGLARLRAGDLAAARESLDAAITLYRAADHPQGEADAQALLGRVHQRLGQDDVAEDLYRSALATARARRDLPRQAALLVDLGVLAQRAGDREQAATLYTAAEEAFETAGRPRDAVSAALDRASLRGDDPSAFEAVLARARATDNDRVEAVVQLNLAALRRTRAPDRARAHLEAARTLAAEHGLVEVQWRVDHLDGLLARDAGDLGAATEHLGAAVERLEHTRRDLDAPQARAFVTGHREVYRDLIDALLAQGDSARAFVVAERLQVADLPGTVALPEEQARLADEEAWLRERLQIAPADSEQRRALRERLAALRVEFAATVDRLRSEDPDFDRRVRVDPEDLEAVQADLDPGVTVLQPVLLQDRLILLVFRHDLLEVRTVDVDPAEVADTVARLARSLRAGLTSRPAWTRETSEQLGRWLLAPIDAELSETEVLAVSLGGVFRQLPFALLRHDDRWLVEHAAVVGITHVGSLQELDAADARFQVDGPGLVLLGNPDGTLAGAEGEVAALAERFPGARTLVGGEGTLDALIHAAEGRRVLHLATHGRIDAARPERSHLVLAGEQPRLSYREIPGLAPWLEDCRLVVLSACESARPVEATASGDDGPVASINGLAAQFRRAGVETLVASLWRVDDASTRTLMVAFYEELGRGRDIATALRRAQLHLLRSQDHAHPWYWAPFVVVGDWR